MSENILTTPEDFKRIPGRDCPLELYYTQPCVKFLKNTPEAQLKHVMEEVGESWEALSQWRCTHNSGDLEHLAEELTDVKCAIDTMLQIMEYGPQGRMRMCRIVNEKNRRRGYWEVKENESKAD